MQRLLHLNRGLPRERVYDLSTVRHPKFRVMGCLKSVFGGTPKMPFALLILQKHRLGLYSRVSNLELMKLQF